MNYLVILNVEEKGGTELKFKWDVFVNASSAEEAKREASKKLQSERGTIWTVTGVKGVYIYS